MLRFVRSASLALAAALALPALAQNDAAVFGLEPGDFAVGFRLFEDDDRTRAVNGVRRGVLHPRPMRTYLWYPADDTDGARPLRFGRYAELAHDDIWPAQIAGDLRERLDFARGPLARSLGSAGFEALLQRRMIAVENAAALAGPFPLIVVGQGLYYESPISFAAFAEYLAGRGFVVATAPLVGTHSPLVKVDLQDLETQVRDLEFLIGRARQESFVSRDRLGVMGFDMGGMAGVVLTMRNSDVDAFVSLDSGIVYPDLSGLPRSSPHYDPAALRVPWLHAAQPRNDAPPPGSSATESLFDTAVHAERYLLHNEVMGHADFTSYALVEGRNAVDGYWGAATPERAAAHRIVAAYVRHFFAAHLSANAAGAAFLEQDVGHAFPSAGMTLEHRSATQGSIDYDELVRMIVNGQTDGAVRELRALAASAPDHSLLTESSLQRLCVSLLYTWNLAAQTLPLIEFSLELYPSSGGGRALLGDAQAQLENYPAAIAAYEDLLRQFPGDPGLEARLEWLRKQR
jgi:dienelactone hydrolase